MTDLITEARELCEKATPGEWKVNHLDDCFIEPRICEIPANGCYDYKIVEANSMFIARSRTLVPELCDALEKAEAEIERLKHIYQPVCRSCGLRNARLFINNSCDRCGGDLRCLAPPEKEGETK